MKTRRVYRFGPFCVDATAKVVLKDGEPVRLARKSVETLLVLVESSGQVVTKEELMSALWPDRVVDEANLAQNVAVIRRALEVERGAPGYIETFAGRGYRIIGPVTMTEEGGEGTGAGAEEVVATIVGGWRLRHGVAAAAVATVVMVGAVWMLRRSTAPASPEELHRAPVTRLAGKEYQPAISADGRRVAFVWEQQGARTAGIWIQGAGENSPRRMTGEEGTHSSPAWSPDGRRLAYMRFKESSGAIVVATVEGGEQRELARVFPSRYGLPNRHLDWSPDGKYLAVDDAESGHEALGIFLVSVETGEKRRLTQPDNVIIGDVDPRFSPDGKSVSFIRAFHRAWQELYTVPAAGGTPRRLTTDARQVSGQDWMPDGQTLVFGSDRSGEFRLWKLRGVVEGVAGLQATAIYGDFPIQLSIARRGEALVYSVLHHDLNIWRLDLGGGVGPEGRWARIIASSGQDASPQYSPQGDKICFRSDRSGEEQLWISDSDGGNPAQVTRGALRPSVGRWSPDGRAIVFNNARSGEIFVARCGADGKWTVRSREATGYHPVFSPDARWIYAGTMNSIVRLPAQEGAASELVRTKGISLGASADGEHIYFVREPADSALWRVETGTGRTSKVLEGLVPYCSSCWALAPGGVYYLGSKAGSPERQALYYHELATGRETALVDYPELLSPIGSGPFSLSREGRYLLCVRVDPSNSDVSRVEPFH